MNRIHRTILISVSCLLLLARPNVGVADELFVTNLVDGVNPLPIPGNQAYTGQLGDDFTANDYLTITKIGVFDDDGDGTGGDLFWRLFNVTTGSLIHSQTVSATTGSSGNSIADNYVWADIGSAINLFAGNVYSVVVYGFDSFDKNFNTNFDLVNLDVEFNTDGLTGAGGRFGGAFDTLPSAWNVEMSSASTQPYNFGAGTFMYSVPEPATLGLLSLGLGLAGFGFSRRKK